MPPAAAPTPRGILPTRTKFICASSWFTVDWMVAWRAPLTAFWTISSLRPKSFNLTSNALNARVTLLLFWFVSLKYELMTESDSNKRKFFQWQLSTNQPNCGMIRELTISRRWGLVHLLLLVGRSDWDGRIANQEYHDYDLATHDYLFVFTTRISIGGFDLMILITDESTATISSSSLGHQALL